MRIGIGVSTYNRAESLKRCLDSIEKYMTLPFVGIVSDDGSTDVTKDMTHDKFTFIHNKNGGIARNKNRIIYRLKEIERCNVIILIEDDVIITEYYFLRGIVFSTYTRNHVNIHMHTSPKPKSGEGKPWNPYIVSDLPCQVIGLSATAIRKCGYMDPRFTGYGFEHCEYSRRLARAGFGGKEDNYYALSDDGMINDKSIPSTGNQKKIDEAREVFKLMHNDTGYKNPWLNEEDKIKFLSEVNS